jgi:peptidoglycan/LPS O-acetylase OafA/YrhL
LSAGGSGRSTNDERPTSGARGVGCDGDCADRRGSAVGGTVADGYLDDILFGLFVAGPLVILAAVIARRVEWAIGQAAAFLTTSISAMIVAEAASHSSSTGALWVPTVAAVQYMCLLVLGGIRLGRLIRGPRDRSRLASSS